MKINIMYLFIGAIIIFFICIILLIFAPKSKSFYDPKLYPFLNSINVDNAKNYIDNITEWEECYNSAEGIKIYPLKLFDVEFPNKSPELYSINSLHPNIKNLFMIKIENDAPTFSHQEEPFISESCLRCIIPTETSKKAGVWINGEIKNFKKGKPIIIDVSKNYTYFNLSKNALMAIIIDLPKKRRNIIKHKPSHELNEYIYKLRTRQEKNKTD